MGGHAAATVSRKGLRSNQIVDLVQKDSWLVSHEEKGKKRTAIPSSEARAAAVDNVPTPRRLLAADQNNNNNENTILL